MSLRIRAHKTSPAGAVTGRRGRAADASQSWWSRFQIDGKIALYERALVCDPENHLLILDLARAYAAVRRNEEAQKMLVNVLTLYPASTWVRTRAVRILTQLSWPRQALDRYLSLLDLDPHTRDDSDIRAAVVRLSEEFRQVCELDDNNNNN